MRRIARIARTQVIVIALLAVGGCGGDDGGEGGAAGSDGGLVGAGGGAGGGAGAAAEVQPLAATEIVFLRTDANDHAQIYAIDSATRAEQMITDLDGAETESFRPALSPDRRWIAFPSRFRTTPDDSDPEMGTPTQAIWVVSADGRQYRRVAPPMPGTAGAACTVDEECTPHGMECDLLIRHCQFRNQRHGLGQVVYSPDGATLWMSYLNHWNNGSQIAGGAVLASVPAAGGIVQLYANQSGCAQVTGPAPAPDGQSLLALQSVCSGGSPGVVTYAIPPGMPEVVFPDNSLMFEAPIWLSDGRRFAHETDDGAGGSVIELIDLDTQQVTTLAAPLPGQTLGGFDISPDDRTLVVTVSASPGGAFESDLYLADLANPAAGLTRLTEGGKSYNPRW